MHGMSDKQIHLKYEPLQEAGQRSSPCSAEFPLLVYET